MRRGAFPGRNPGIFTCRASLRKAASIAFSNSWAVTATCRRTLLPSSDSTDVSMGRRSVPTRPVAPRTCSGPGETACGGRRNEKLGVMDVGLTHVALPVTDPDDSVRFYERYADMRVVHRREDGPGSRV